VTARRVLVTRDPAAARPLAALLRERGYEPCAARLLEASLPPDPEPLRALLREAVRPTVPTWLCVTSTTAVHALAAVADTADWGARLDAARSPGAAPGTAGDSATGPARIEAVATGVVASSPAPGASAPVVATDDAARPAPLRIAAVGAATARALADHGVGVDFVPAGTSSAAGMLAEWPEGLDMRWKASVARRSGGRGVAGADTSSSGLGTRAGTGATGHAGSATGTAGAGSPGDVPRALLPVSALASDTLEDGLRARGYRVCRVRAYDMEPAPAPRPLSTIASEPDDAPELDRAAARAACASGELAAVVVTAPSRAGQLLDGNRPAEGTAWIAIGEPTARALREQGLTPVTAAHPTPEALADAVVHALGTPGTAGRNKFS